MDLKYSLSLVALCNLGYRPIATFDFEFHHIFVYSIDLSAPNGEATRGSPLKLPSISRYSRSSKNFVKVKFEEEEEQSEADTGDDTKPGSSKSDESTKEDGVKTKKGSFSRLRSMFSLKR